MTNLYMTIAEMDKDVFIPENPDDLMYQIDTEKYFKYDYDDMDWKEVPFEWIGDIE